MKHALICSGGGYKCAFQVGAYEVLVDNGITFSAMSGISGGGLNVALMGQDKHKELHEFWNAAADGVGGIIFGPNLGMIENGKLVPNFDRIKEVGLQGISKWDISKAITSSFFKGLDLKKTGQKLFDNLDYAEGILDNKPLISLLKKTVKIKDFKMPVHTGITEFTTGLGIEISVSDFIKDEDCALAFAASANMPVIVSNIPRINTKRGTFRELVDGGLRTVSPIGQVFDTVENTDEEWTFWVVNTSSKILAPMEDVRRNSVKLGRTVDILLNQVFNDDIEKTLIINKVAKQLGKREVKINIIEPSAGLLGGTLDCRKETIDQRIEMGRSLTAAYF